MKYNSKETAMIISDYVNSMSNDEKFKKFAEFWTAEHRSLQQNFVKLMLYCIIELSNLPDCKVDPRNETSVRIARMINKLLEEEYFISKGRPLLPCI